jgi:nucleoside-diphosphate-sugar epimerase
MRVFIAGGTGAVGRPTVKRLIGAGHIVIGMAARPASADVLESLGRPGRAPWFESST